MKTPFSSRLSLAEKDIAEMLADLVVAQNLEVLEVFRAVFEPAFALADQTFIANLPPNKNAIFVLG